MNDQETTLNNLSKDLIKKLTDELNDELEKLLVLIPKKDKVAVIEKCDAIMKSLNSRYKQLKKQSLK
ncbi:MAG TPA: hypothetical protein VK783_13655 [Bacteroidia bacterium]|jgi:hypothetical protein|nr:hypothetical protein [Bacteroidia bacterium]